MNAAWVPWVVGIAFSLGVGWFGVWLFLKVLRKYMNLEPGLRTQAVPSSLTGVVERLFFTIVVAFDVSGAGVAMMAWLGVKMAGNWNRPLGPVDS